MRIAIIGAGFSGLATAWHLISSPVFRSAKVTIFDAQGVGGGASGIAAGLLHPYAGAHAKLNRMGKEGMQATSELIEVAANAVGRPVAFNPGIFRPALTSAQEQDFRLCAEKYPSDVQWMDKVACKELFPYLVEAPGIWLKDGLVINSPLYLQGLWQACAHEGACFEKQRVSSLSELSEFDQIVVAAGADATSFPELADIPLSIVKGQVLELEWPETIPALPFALNSQAYLLMTDQKTCLAGATFERDYRSKGPDIVTAMKEIMPKLTAMIPLLHSAHVKNCYAGMRVVTPSHLPLIKRLSPQTWVITGMGSKGLLYHALMAQQLVQRMGLEI